MGTLIRLQKIIADAGIASRREAENIIREGRVTLNGKPVTEMGVKADPEKDHVKVDGKLIRTAVKELIYLMMHKPKQVMCTVDDPEGRETILDLIRPKLKERIWPVGRLDYHSEGLLILTNDGALTLRLTHPRYKVPKMYEVKVKGVPSPEKIERLKKGVYLEDGKTQPCAIQFVRTTENNSRYTVELREGRKQQIRRMFMSVNHPVMKLKRVSYGPLTIGNLQPGETRLLTEKEVMELKQAAGLAKVNSGKGHVARGKR